MTNPASAAKAAWQWAPRIRSGYDQVADEYARRIYEELRQKPFDRELLNRFAKLVRDHGRVCDLGCGPGQIARHLRDQGVNSFGLDLAPEMVRVARQLNPEIPFVEGNMLAMDPGDNELAGIAAFYSIIHIPRESVADALREMLRVLRPGGRLLLAFHLGKDILHEDKLWERTVDLDYVFFEVGEMCGYLKQAGFEISETHERPPYPPEVEYQSRRGYILARKPTGSPES